MRTRFRDKECGISNGMNSHHTHPGRVWGILHVIKYHHWRHVKRRLTQKRQGFGRHDARDEIPGTSDDSGIDNMSVHFNPNTTASNVEETLANSTPQAKYSIKSKIKALLHEDTFKKKGRHKRSSTCPTKSRLTRVDSVHRLEVDPLSEMLLTVESPEPVLETFQNHLAAGTLDVLSPVFSGKHVNTNSNKCVDCGTLFSSEALEHDQIHKHQMNLSNSFEDLSEEKLFNAKIVTADASPHLFKDFLDALDVINTNKDFLLKYINDPGSPLPFDTQNQDSPSGKSRRTKSISFPVSGSTSGTKEEETGEQINQIVDELFNIKVENRESQSQNHMQNVSISPSSSHKFDQEWLERDYNYFSSASPQTPTPNHVKTRNFKDLRKKLKHIIEESKNEKRRITMDAILDKIPRGNKLSKTVKKLIHDQSKDPTNGEGKDSVTSGYGSNLSSFHSFNKRQVSSMRTTSLRESADRYSQLYQTCFNNEVKYPKTESLKLRTEDKSSFLNTSKSITRVLSMPNLKSYFYQSEELLNILSPQNSIRKLEDRTSTSVTNESKSQIMSPAFADNTNQESILNAEQKEVLVRSDSESGSDGNDEKKEDKSIGIDGLGNLRERESEGASCNEHELGSATESSTMLAEANSAFSSDTSFLDATFELENVLEESDSELKSSPAEDGLHNNRNEQQEAKVDQSEVVENIDNFQNFGTLTNHFNYEIPWIDVDENNEAAFNYVRKVLELSGFTSHESLGLWYSDDQPVDPSVYEELEGCLLLDPECSGNCDEGGQCHHLLLFDIINEGLLEIFGRSYNYYPRPLSSLSHVNPLQPGDNVLHKVWKLISCYLSSNSEAYPSLDYYVSKDLAKCDGWMNLQFDSECVGLELDDLIFDDLLEEIIYS